MRWDEQLENLIMGMEAPLEFHRLKSLLVKPSEKNSCERM
jgi:hypothetical protein